MTTVSVRISDKLKKEMDEHPTINWSEVLRQAINDKLKSQKGINLVKAVLITERVRKKALDGWNSTEFIRADRLSKGRINNLDI